MSKGSKKLEITKNYGGIKKGHVQKYSRDNAMILLKNKVAKEVKQGIKGKKPKAKAKK